MDVTIGEGRPYNKQGYLIMPSTYESKIQGTFILSVKCDRPFEIISSKWIDKLIHMFFKFYEFHLVFFNRIKKNVIKFK